MENEANLTNSNESFEVTKPWNPTSDEFINIAPASKQPPGYLDLTCIDKEQSTIPSALNLQKDEIQQKKYQPIKLFVEE